VKGPKLVFHVDDGRKNGGRREERITLQRVLKRVESFFEVARMSGNLPETGSCFGEVVSAASSLRKGEVDLSRRQRVCSSPEYRRY